MTETSIVPAQAAPLAMSGPPPAVEQLIALAIERGVPIETMEKLMSMHERLNANRAKAEFIAAMAAFQGACPQIKKTKSVSTREGKHAYSYAPLEVVVEQVGPLLADHGFSYRHEMKLRNDGVLVLCHVTHIGGHTETTPMDVPLGTKTQVMSDSQVVAAATTFAKRYAFLSAFGIMTADEDNDGQTVPGRGNPVTPRGMNLNRTVTQAPPDYVECSDELQGPLPATAEYRPARDGAVGLAPATAAQRPASRANVAKPDGTAALATVYIQGGEIRKMGEKSKTPGKPYIRWHSVYGGETCEVNYYGDYSKAQDGLATDNPEAFTGEMRAQLGEPFKAGKSTHYTAEHIELPYGADLNKRVADALNIDTRPLAPAGALDDQPALSPGA
jgi:hypothetical protein